MIRVIIERKLKKVEHISRLIRQIRVAAMAQQGYISGETLVGTEDTHAITVISTWKSLEDWQAWEKSEQRIALERQIAALLTEPPMVKTYRVMSAEELEYLEDPEGWLRERERHSLDG